MLLRDGVKAEAKVTFGFLAEALVKSSSPLTLLSLELSLLDGHLRCSLFLPDVSVSFEVVLCSAEYGG